MYIDAMGHRFGADLVCIAKSGCKQTFAQHQIDQTRCEGCHVERANTKGPRDVAAPSEELLAMILRLEECGVSRRKLERISRTSSGTICRVMRRRTNIGVKTLAHLHEVVTELLASHDLAMDDDADVCEDLRSAVG